MQVKRQRTAASRDVADAQAALDNARASASGVADRLSRLQVVLDLQTCHMLQSLPATISLSHGERQFAPKYNRLLSDLAFTDGQRPGFCQRRGRSLVTPAGAAAPALQTCLT